MMMIKGNQGKTTSTREMIEIKRRSIEGTETDRGPVIKEDVHETEDNFDIQVMTQINERSIKFFTCKLCHNLRNKKTVSVLKAQNAFQRNKFLIFLNFQYQKH